MKTILLVSFFALSSTAALVACSDDSSSGSPAPSAGAGGSINQAGAAGGPQAGTGPSDAGMGGSNPAGAAGSAGMAAGSGGAPPSCEPKVDTGDVGSSKGCEAYCERSKSECNSTCTPASTCKIDKGHCAAATEAFLNCQAKTGQWYCGADGFSIVSDCEYDESLCLPEGCGGNGSGGSGGGGGKVTCDLIDFGTTSCNDCAQSSCCAEVEATFNDEDATADADCYLQCADATCRKQCDAKHPTGAPLLKAMIQCLGGTCASACN